MVRGISNGRLFNLATTKARAIVMIHGAVLTPASTERYSVLYIVSNTVAYSCDDSFEILSSYVDY